MKEIVYGKEYIKPSRIVGNLYFVGVHCASTHIIDTGAGLIIIEKIGKSEKNSFLDPKEWQRFLNKKIEEARAFFEKIRLFDFHLNKENVKYSSQKLRKTMFRLRFLVGVCFFFFVKSKPL